MDAFRQLKGTTAPLDRANVDTDQIIPKQYLKSIKRTGFGDYLFDAWRFTDQGVMGMTPNERKINREFVLNQPAYQGAAILLARDNFGCGSSREHAVWALKEFGFKAVIAPSFADIFFGNCFKNGVLPIVLNAEIVANLIAKSDGKMALEIDLEHQLVIDGEKSYVFEIDPALKQKMLKGMDDIAMTLEEVKLIENFEARHKARQPWLFRG